MTNNVTPAWCDYEAGHPAHIDERKFPARYCPGDLEFQRPTWCPILVPHEAHRAQNQFGGWNECSGKTFSVAEQRQASARISSKFPVEKVISDARPEPMSEEILVNVLEITERFRELQEAHERKLEEAFKVGGLGEVFRLGQSSNPFKHLRHDYKTAVFPLVYGVSGGPVPTFEEWIASALALISEKARAEYAQHVDSVRRSESQRLYGHPGASAGVGETAEGRTQALREAFLNFLVPKDLPNESN